MLMPKLWQSLSWRTGYVAAVDVEVHSQLLMSTSTHHMITEHEGLINVVMLRSRTIYGNPPSSKGMNLNCWRAIVSPTDRRGARLANT